MSESKLPGALLPAALGLEPFRPRLPWLNGDLQTLRDTLRPVALPPEAGEPITIPVGRGDQLLALLDPPLGGAEPRALVVLMHGLGGSSCRSGLRRMGLTLQRAGFAVLRLNMRGAGPGRELARGTYAASCNSDLLPALARARELAGGLPLLGMGISLGGTKLLNALLTGPGLLDGLVTISSPLDLSACSAQIERPRNRIYKRWLLQRLVAQTLADPFGLSEPERESLAGRGPVGPMDSILAFDAAITAPRWGYDSVDHYYQEASPLLQLQAQVAVLPPTLVLHAIDDPWVPVAAARDLAALQLPGVEVLLTTAGGHNGFHARCDGCGAGRASSAPGNWGDRLTARWFQRLLAQR
ncbi:YheT family hydrolase [Vulcanococcus sp.]|uniref:YheT family hydrolase n=1 Tax=Vulcanococcus sp. TaxID=2856995 RepID=UPI0037D9AB4F